MRHPLAQSCVGRLFSLFVVCWLLNVQVQAAPSAALGYEPKYPPDFSHFDYANPDAPKGGELVLSGFGNYDSLNPYLFKGISASGLGLVFDTLMVKSLDEPFSIYGLLAEDIELAEDELSVTFRLNPRARFSNGEPVTAGDVKFSFDTLRGEHAHPMYRIYWADVEDCEVLDERTVRFNFKQANPELHLILSELPVFSKAWLDGEPFNETARTLPVASGPYQVESFDLGKNITYRRNPDYWAAELNVNRGMYNFDRIVYKYYKDRTVSLEALKAGEFDFMDIYNSKDWAVNLSGDKFDSGRLIKTLLPHHNNAGMQGFVFNLRRPIFQDRRVRKAINLAFDFQWTNKNLFYGQYTRCDSYFSNSELAARGLPEGEELALLEPHRDQLREEVFTQVWEPVGTEPPDSLRNNLRRAKLLLDEAGWQLKDGVLQKDDMRLEFEFIIVQKEFERILAPFAQNLAKLGIRMSYRTVDPALYQKRAESFDFDMMTMIFSQSQSPGNEQMDYWHSGSADQPGSRNYLGLKNPVVDDLVRQLVYTKGRETLLTVTHALDRVLLWGEYVVPNWYINAHRVVYWNKFGRPETPPLYYPTGTGWVVNAWWQKQEEH